MLVSQAHSFTQQARLAITLAWVAGFTNVMTLLTCATVTSHVTGSVSLWGERLAEGRWPAFISFLLAAFFAGAVLSALCTETGRRRGWESIYVLPITLQLAMLAAFAWLVRSHVPGSVETGARLHVMTGLASAAMGLQNATITRISGGVIRTTHMTGVFTDLGLELVQFLYWLRDRNRSSPPAPATALVHSVRTHPTARRLALLFSVVASFAVGAGVGTFAYERLPEWAMFGPVLLLLWIVWHDVRTPICEIEPSTLVEGSGGFGLPYGLALYHLRKDRDRKGGVHRLPDLLRWWERLPLDKRVVILDLTDVTVIDDNAALELRALLKQARAAGRRVLVAGVTGEQYRSMRDAGAGDALDQSTVVPDVELAVARGLSELEELVRPRV
ncbi:MAG TPA: DUF1275 family protein [Phycisphaerales bacterium]|nr:DUF1275 family protein [Phycisphaerales bacterium]